MTSGCGPEKKRNQLPAPTKDSNSGTSQLALAADGDSQIRFFQTTLAGKLAPHGPRREVSGSGWLAFRPETAATFSADLCQFARELRQQTNIPVGLICCWVENTPIESWISAEGFRRGRRKHELADLQDALRSDPRLAERQRQRREAWEEQVLSRYHDKQTQAKRNLGESVDDSRWPEIRVPEEPRPGQPGVFWYRRRIAIPAGWSGHPLTLSLGRTTASDQIYFNAELVSAVHSSGQKKELANQRCTIPPGCVRAGRENLLAIRIIDFAGTARLSGPAATLYISPIEEEHVRLSLSGSWRYGIESLINLDTAPAQPRPAEDFTSPAFMTTLFNTMIAPWTGVAVRGIIWEQGESNVGRHQDYLQLLPILIRDWRRQWKADELPFVIVQMGATDEQLPADSWNDEDPPEHAWASLREVQATVAAGMNATGLVVTLDSVLNQDDHSVGTTRFGSRLAAEAGRLCGLTVATTSGPVFHHQKIHGDVVRLSFRDIGSGLRTTDGAALDCFTLAGQDGRFFRADATIEGDTIVLRSERVPVPIAARYAWGGAPRNPNLYNGEGYPAVPFRTNPPDYLKLP